LSCLSRCPSLDFCLRQILPLFVFSQIVPPPVPSPLISIRSPFSFFVSVLLAFILPCARHGSPCPPVHPLTLLHSPPPLNVPFSSLSCFKASYLSLFISSIPFFVSFESVVSYLSLSATFPGSGVLHSFGIKGPFMLVFFALVCFFFFLLPLAVFFAQIL